jgi:hypothetical protein
MVRGRADLPRVHGARCADRPVHLLRGAATGAVAGGQRDEVLKPLITKVHRTTTRSTGRAVPGAARRCAPRFADLAAPRPVDLVKRKFNPLVPNRLWIADFPMYHMVRDGLRRVRHRRICPPHHRLAGGHHDAHGVGARRVGVGDIHPRPGRCHRPVRADPPERRGLAMRLSRSPTGCSPKALRPWPAASGLRWTTPSRNP